MFSCNFRAKLPQKECDTILVREDAQRHLFSFFSARFERGAESTENINSTAGDKNWVVDSISTLTVEILELDKVGFEEVIVVNNSG